MPGRLSWINDEIIRWLTDHNYLELENEEDIYSCISISVSNKYYNGINF